MSRLGAFIAGMGTGYFQRTDKDAETARQEKLDQIVLDRAQRETQAYEEEQALKRELSDAGAQPVVVDNSAAPGDGVGPVRPDSLPGRYQVGGAAFSDKAQADSAAAKAQKTPEQINAAMSGVLRSRGLYERANALDASSKQAKMLDIQLSAAERKRLDDDFNRSVDDEIRAAGGDIFKGIAAMGTKTNIGGLAGAEVRAVPSPDGKTMNFVAVGKDGNERIVKSYSNDAAGELAAKEFIMKVEPEVRAQWLRERANVARQDAKDARAEEWKQKEFDLNKSNVKFNQEMARANLSINQMQAGFAAQRAAREKAMFEAEAKIPPGDKLKIQALDKEIELVNKAIVDAKAKGEWNPSNAGSQELMAQLERAQDRHTAALAPFLSNRGSGNRDPMEAKDADGAGNVPPQPSQTRAAPASPPASLSVAASGIGAVKSEDPGRWTRGGYIPKSAEVSKGQWTRGGYIPPSGAPQKAAKPATAAAPKIDAAAMKSLSPLVESLAQAKTQLQAAAASQDSKAASAYAANLASQKAALEAAVREKFKGSADQVLSAIYAEQGL